MASQVLSGSSNPSYTNNTGQNVRVVINFMSLVSSISWGGVSATSSSRATIGRNLAFTSIVSKEGTGGSTSFVNATTTTGGTITGYTRVPVTTEGTSVSTSIAGSNMYSTSNAALPTELMLAPGQTFSADCRAYNIVVIPEAG